MKTLEAKNLFFIVYTELGTFALFSIYLYVEYSSLEVIMNFACLFAVIIIITLLGYIRLRKRHWIKYGERKIVLCRETKEIKNGRAVGSFKTKIIEIPVDDIYSYGRLWEIPGTPLDAFRTGGMIMANLYAFGLNDGTRIGFEGVHYSEKQLAELFDYIYKETGKKAITKKSEKNK